MQSHPRVRSDRVSQEAWVISLAAADHPDDVDFVIAVSGSGTSVAEQQVWGIEAQSRAAGRGPDDVQRAALVGRLLVDWRLSEPRYREVNEQAARSLGAGPWQDLIDLVSESDTLDPAAELGRMIEILTSIQDEPWVQALHLEKVYLPALRSIGPDQLEAAQMASEQSLPLDPRDHLTRVTSPVLAFFGRDDIVQPTDRSARLFAEYLEEAENDDVTIVILPDVGHDILPTTPGYWEQMVEWLDAR